MNSFLNYFVPKCCNEVQTRQCAHGHCFVTFYISSAQIWVGTNLLMLWTWGKGLPYFFRTTFLSPVRSKRKYTASLPPLLFLLNHTNWKDKCHMRKGLVTLEALMLKTNLIVQYMFLFFLHSVLFIVFVCCSPCTLCFSIVRYCHYVFAFSDYNYSATNM